MGIFTSDIKSLDDMFVTVLQKVYYAERQIEEQAGSPASRELP